MAQICASRNRTPGGYPSASSSREDYRGYQSLSNSAIIGRIGAQEAGLHKVQASENFGYSNVACWAEARVTRYSTYYTHAVLRRPAITYYVPSSRPVRTKLWAASIFVPTYTLQTHRNLQK